MPSQAQSEALSVSDAVALAKRTVGRLPSFLVIGEVTNFRGPNARSGHCYFQVKDEEASMDVIVWRNIYAHADIELRDGLEVQMQGSFDVYQQTGKLSFVARHLEASGEGLLRQRVAQLANKLRLEGLLDDARKRPVPRFCERIAVVTSLSGSVLQDVCRTLARRNPLVRIDVFGCAVQGREAPDTIQCALMCAAATQPDCILLVRGGGSYEDLMAFNDEALARCVAACAVPVVTGIGHEPDTCICDMVADKRCSTPTAAAESVAPALDEITLNMNSRAQRLSASMQHLIRIHNAELKTFSDSLRRVLSARLERERTALDILARHRCMIDPSNIVDDRVADLMQTEQRLEDAMLRLLARQNEALEQKKTALQELALRVMTPYTQRLASLASVLEALSPVAVLKRGYAIASDAQGHVLTSASQVDVGDIISVKLGQGELQTQVLKRSIEEK